MRKRTEQSVIGGLTGIPMIVLGGALTLTIVGALLGVPMMIAGGRMAKTQKVLRCKSCGHTATT